MGADTGFGWRPIDAGQVPAWASLITAIEAVDHPDENLGEEYLLEEFADPRHDFARGSVAVYDGPVMIGYCVLTSRSTADPVHEMRQSGGVHPAYRGRAIGRASCRERV